MKKLINLILVITILIFVTACSNPFQKEVEVIGTPEIVDDEKTKQESVSKEQTNEIEDTDTSNEIHNEQEIVNYFSNIEQETNKELEIDNSNSIKSKVTNSFVNIIDFIFYDKEIKGVKFNDLTDSAKKRILNIAGRMDNSIENKFPNYKENINTKSKNTYNKATDKIHQTLDYLSEKAEEKIGEENYNSVKDTKEEVKDKAKSTYNTVKEKAKSTKDKLKSWYEEKTGK